MPAITTNDLKNGITLELDNGLFTVVEFQHVKPGKGGAFVRTKLRNLRNGNVFEKTFNAGIRVEQAILDKRDMQFLYKDGDDFVFMDTESYDQMNISPIALGDAADYLVESAMAIIALHNGEIVTVEIPASAELVIADTEPGVIPSGQHRGKTVDAVWAEDPQYVWFLSQRSLNHVQCLRYKDFFDSCPAVVQRAKELTEGLSMPEVRQQQTSSSTFKPGGWRGW